MVTDVPHCFPLILCDDFYHHKHPTSISVFRNYCKIIDFVDNAGGCLRGDTAHSHQDLLEMQLDECVHGSIVITLDPFFSQQKYWKGEIFSIHITYSDISWLSQCRPNKSGRMNVFKWTKMKPPNIMARPIGLDFICLMSHFLMNSPSASPIDSICLVILCVYYHCVSIIG